MKHFYTHVTNGEHRVLHGDGTRAGEQLICTAVDGFHAGNIVAAMNLAEAVSAFAVGSVAEDIYKNGAVPHALAEKL